MAFQQAILGQYEVASSLPVAKWFKFHLTVELPFLDFPDFFRLDVSSPQFVRLFTAGSFMFNAGAGGAVW